ncbi:hypothetical protein [Streptomyces sp. NPDC003393]
MPAAPLSASVLRVMRTAAGRRALHLVLLVGALFALGFLCGERAQAAEGGAVVPSPTAVLNAVSGREPATGRPDHGRERVSSLPARARVARPAVGTAGSPVTATAMPKVRVPAAVSLPALPTRPVPSAPPAPDLSEPSRKPSHPSALPPLRQLPDRPDLKGLPDLSVLPDRLDAPLSGIAYAGSVLPLPKVSLPSPVTPPVRITLSSPVTLPAPVTPPEPVAPTTSASGSPSLPQQPSDAAVAGPAGHRGDGHHADGPGRTAERVAGPTAAIAFGPRPAHRTRPPRTVDPLSGQAATHGTSPAAHDPSAAPHAATGQVPGGDPDGVVGTRSTADSGEPVHGDLHAVTSGGRAPLPRTHGTVTPLAAAGTRDVREDVPVYPG